VLCAMVWHGLPKYHEGLAFQVQSNHPAASCGRVKASQAFTPVLIQVGKHFIAAPATMSLGGAEYPRQPSICPYPCKGFSTNLP